jgi:PAS domain-containing protein
MMTRTIAEVLSELARQASLLNEALLAYLCGMAALEAEGKALPAPPLNRHAIGIWDWDVIGDRNHLDPGCAELFGVDLRKAQAGMPTSAYLNAIHPDDVHRVSNAILHTLKEGGVYEAEYRIVTGDRVRPVFAKGFCTLDEARRPIRFPGAIVELPASPG